MQIRFSQFSLPALRDVPNLIVWVALGLVALRSIFGFFPFVDTATAALLAVALIPSLPSLWRSAMNSPSGMKVELSEVAGVGETILHHNEPANYNRQGVSGHFMAFNRDPNQALAVFSAELERAVRAISQRRGLRCDQSLKDTTETLVRLGAINELTASSIHEFADLSQRATHGADTDPGISTWLIENGEKILAILDSKN
jgi:hypothetical protein